MLEHANQLDLLRIRRPNAVIDSLIRTNHPYVPFDLLGPYMTSEDIVSIEKWDCVLTLVGSSLGLF